MPARHADVVVVGAGIAGAAAAYFLTEAGHSVELIDAERPGFGASGRNPGFHWLQTKAAGPQMRMSHDNATCRAVPPSSPSKVNSVGSSNSSSQRQSLSVSAAPAWATGGSSPKKPALA